MHKVDPIYLEHQLKRWMRPDAHRFVRPDWRRFVRPEFQADHPFALYERKYSAEQPRVPAGSREGGQWTDGSPTSGGAGDEIPANARPVQFSPSKEGWHQYQSGPNVVCPADLQCSREEIADQLARYAVPGQDPTKPVENGGNYPVYAPGTGQYVGTVETTIGDDGLTVTNRTQEGHIFYDGKVERRAQQGNDGSWHVTTEGIGNNVTPGMNIINQAVGPEIFDKLDQQMRANIEQHHAKAIVSAQWRSNYNYGDRAHWLSAGGETYARR